MADRLRDALEALLRPGAKGNPAVNALLDDYTTYHAVLIAVGGLFVVALACWPASPGGGSGDVLDPVGARLGVDPGDRHAQPRSDSRSIEELLSATGRT